MNGRHPLLAIKRAVRANDVQAVRQLLRHDPRLSVARGHGWTPLQDAAFHARTQILEVMLAEGADITPADVVRALHHAAQLPHADPAAVRVLCATAMFRK
jgi:ankyrin repeat protein